MPRDRGRETRKVKTCVHAAGVGNLMLLIFGDPSTLALGLVVVLAPFTLASALQLTAFLACSSVSVALGDRRERVELLVCAIGVLQPPSEGEKYQESMLAEIRAASSPEVLAIGVNLIQTAPRTILAAWVRFLRHLRRRVESQRALRG
ncbi:MAG: hypothetical protein ACRDRH_05235 [Pseudonocardia sp.]